MQFDLEKTVETIKNNPTFLKLKEITENNSGHDHEVEYDHAIRTYEVAKDAVKGEFVTSPESRTKFKEFLDEQIDGIEKIDILQIGALIHDIGKLTVFDDNGKKNLWEI